MPQNAASAVMDLLQMLINPTGPQDDANTVPMKSINQKTLGGKIKHSANTAKPVTNMAIRDALTVNCFLRTTISLLTLKPIRDKNVDAEDSAAAIIPASNIAPRKLGTRFLAAHIMTVSDGESPELARFISPPIP